MWNSAFIGALGHVTTTILVIAALSGLSGTVISHKMYGLVSSTILVAFGSYYTWSYTRGGAEEIGRCCGSDKGMTGNDVGNEDGSGNRVEEDRTKAKESSVGEDKRVSNAGAISLITMTSLSPCVGSLPILSTVIVSADGVSVTRVVSAWMTLLVTAAGAMCALAGVSFVGAKNIKLRWVRRHERLAMGLGLIIVGLLTWVVFAKHEHMHMHAHAHAHAHDGSVDHGNHDAHAH